VRLTRLFLRNYRVYEDPLELELPAGLVGIYGPNGAGKSVLVESIRFALWGKSRTGLGEVRTAGVAADCTVELEFEHEGHLYVVRRVLTGINATPKAAAFADGAQMAEGARDVGRYVQSILGVDDAAFRASVFAEQKQLAAFSAQAPEKRRELVLRLLGITPLDRARDAARKDARALASQHDELRKVLPDLDALGEELAEAERRAAGATAAADEAAARAAEGRTGCAEAEAALERVEALRRTADELVAEGKAVKAELVSSEEQAERLERELAELAEAERELASLQADADGLPEAEDRARLVAAVVVAQQALDRLPVVDEPPPPDEGAADAAGAEARELAEALAGVEGQLRAAEAERTRAAEAVERSAVLTSEADCPLCGQALGEAFADVVAHRHAEAAEVQARWEALQAERTELRASVRAATKRAEAAAAERDERRRARERWQAATDRRAEVGEALAAAVATLGRDLRPGEAAEVVDEVHRRRAAADRCRRLEGRLERRDAAEAALEAARARASDAAGRRGVLLVKLKGLGFRPEDADSARAAREAARRRADELATAREEAVLAAASGRAAVEAATTRLADGREQHGHLEELADRSRHLGRLSDLLSAFRGSVVASVGPRLAAQAADLFAELTDREYDRLQVDPETYEIQILDQGRAYGMDRFSGSETDLANLALRVAISEHVRFQSGGAVGLLVLDEVFGPLDDERKERMLLALERLRSRFRQVLVVTHAGDVKEQVPSAIEVVKLPGRRATARVIAGV
jgi:DNA repair exonuclease SbcCD ATPase subunit